MRVQLGRSRVGIDRIGDLVVARLVETAEVVPDLAHVWVEADRPRVGVESITVLADLVVQDTDRTPECRVAAITVYSLLISFVCFVVPLTSHKGSSQKVPAMSVGSIYTFSHLQIGTMILVTDLSRGSW